MNTAITKPVFHKDGNGRLMAIVDSKYIGSTVNSLAAHGEIKPVRLSVTNGPDLEFNSTWAATDWLKANGFYTDNQNPKYEINYI